MKTSKKGAPRDGVVRHEVARIKSPHHETIEDRMENMKVPFEVWIEEMKK